MFISHKYKAIFVHIQRTGGNSVQQIFEEFDPDLIETIHIDPSKKRTKHCFVSDIQETVEPDVFSSYTKFSIARNLFDRLVSWYSMFKHGFGKDDRMMKVDDKAASLGIYYKGLKYINNMNYAKKAWLLKGWTTAFQLFKRYEADSLETVAVQHAKIGTNVMMEIQENATNFTEFVRLPRDHESGLFERFYFNQLDYLSTNDQILVDHILRFETLSQDFNQLAQTIDFEGRLPHVNKSTREADYRNYYDKTTQEMVYQRFKRDFDYFGYDF